MKKNQYILYDTCKIAYQLIRNNELSRNKKLYRLKKLGFSPQEAMKLIPFDPEIDII